MRRLHHFCLDPFARKLRIYLKEKGLDFELQSERPWDPSEAVVEMSPGGALPVLVEANGRVLCDSTAICEYYEEVATGPTMLGLSPEARAETRRLVGWFDHKLDREVTAGLLEEKIFKRFRRDGVPDSRAIHAGRAMLGAHLDYIGWLADRRNWLAGDDFSLADMAAAAQLSTLDYLGDVPWDDHPLARDWYARVKSRPSFRPLLSDSLAAAPPAAHYADLDF